MKRGPGPSRRTPLTRSAPLRARARSAGHVDPGQTPPPESRITSKRSARIRHLRPDEPIPSQTPGRYRSSHGYIRLRWPAGPGLYVEEYEHRVVAGCRDPMLHVHHINEVKDDNRPENLRILTPAEHRAEHHEEFLVNRPRGPKPGTVLDREGRAVDWHEVKRMDRVATRRQATKQRTEEMRRLYLEEGLTTVEIGLRIGLDASGVTRKLQSVGVNACEVSKAAPFNAGDAVELYRQRIGIGRISRHYGVDSKRVLAAVDAAGVLRHKAGRAPARIAPKLRALIIERDETCARCGAEVPLEVHHRARKGMGGSRLLDHPANLIALCGLGNVTGCHGWAHTAPEAAEQGLRLGPGQEPADVAILHHGVWVLLTDDGWVLAT